MTNDANSPNENEVTPPEVYFSRRAFIKVGVLPHMQANQTVLEAAGAAGVSIDYQCRSGICVTFRCKLLGGHATMPTRDALSDADEAEGYILACQAHAIEDITVDA